MKGRNNVNNTTVKKHLSVKVQTVYALVATAAAVLLPQLFHIFGTVGGETWLPMHLPVLMVGFIAGPVAGSAAGVMSPLVSFALTGMPKMVLLPFMVIELCVYGLCAGLLKDVKMPSLLKVLSAQAIGRAARAVFILTAFYMGHSTLAPAIIYTSIVEGLAGIILQLVLIPIALKLIERKKQ